MEAVREGRDCMPAEEAVFERVVVEGPAVSAVAEQRRSAQ